MFEIKKLDVWQLSKFQMVIMAIMGFILGFVYFILGLTFASFGENYKGPIGLVGLGTIGLIVLPILYGLIGLIGGAVSAFIYNLVAKWVGGIKIDLQKR